MAHEYSGIGVFSNMITRLWNRDKPDAEAAALICMTNNYSIDAAKTGFLNSYESYPKIKARVNKAIGGKNGKMPHFFQYSKNGRKNDDKQKDKSFAKQNNSTMNRICRRFDDIGNINMNYAGIAPFNWQMMMDKPCLKTNNELVSLFCDMDTSNISNLIESKGYNEAADVENVCGFELLKEDIISEIENRYGSIEEAYPFIAKYLFTGENVSKSTHKQMFWRVFGDIALNNIRNNIKDCDICPHCKMHIPSWVKNHVCNKASIGFFECVDCGKMCERVNSRQYRCEECQKIHRATSVKQNFKRFYDKTNTRKKRYNKGSE